MAAQLNLYQERRSPEEELPRKLTPTVGNVGLTPGVNAAADTFARMDQAKQTTWASNQLTDLHLQTMQAFQDAQGKAAPDGSGFTNSFMADFEGKAKALVNSAGRSPYAAQMVQNGVNNLREHFQDQALQFEAKQGVAYRVDSINRNTEKAASLVEADPSQLSIVGGPITDAITGGNFQPSERLQLAKQVNATLSLAAARGRARLDPAGTMQAIDKPTGDDPVVSQLTDQQRDGIRSLAQTNLARAQGESIAKVYHDQGPQAGAAALAAVDKLPYDDQTRELIKSHAEQATRAVQVERSQQFAPQITALEQRVHLGTAAAGDKDVATGLYNKLAITREHYSSLLAGIDKANGDQGNAQADLNAAFAEYQNGTPWDPEKSDDKKKAAALFTAMTDKTPPGTMEYVNRAADITARTGVVPEPAVSWARANLVSGEPKQAAAAAELIARVSDASPRGQSYAIDERTRTMAEGIARAVRAGTDPAAAVQMAREAANLPDDQRKALQTDFGKKVKNGTFDSNTLKHLLRDDEQKAPTGTSVADELRPGLFSSMPTIPEAMRTEWQDLAGAYYIHSGGNVELAQHLAEQDIAKTWGATEVNGKREIMKYAPEQMYPGLTAPMIRHDLEESLKGDPATSGVSPADVHLAFGPTTQTTSGKVWTMVHTDKDGNVVPVYDKNNQPRQYVLPVDKDSLDRLKSWQQAQQADANAKALKKGEQARKTEQALRTAQEQAGDALMHYGATP